MKPAGSQFSALVGLALALTGCGGGGSTSAPVQPPTMSLSSVVDSLATLMHLPPNLPVMAQHSAHRLRIHATACAVSRFATLTATFQPAFLRLQQRSAARRFHL